MQTVYLICEDKHLKFKDHSLQYFELISDNDDYVINIDIQDERRNAMFLRIVFPDKTWRELTIPADGNVEIPLWALQFNLLELGVTSAGYATMRGTKVAVRGSIKSICGEEEMEIPEQSTIDELIDIVNDIKSGKSALPDVTEDDNGKMLQVQNGEWKVLVPPSGTAIAIDETLKFDSQNRLGVNTTDSMTQDNTLPITAAAVYTQVGNIEALLETL